MLVTTGIALGGFFIERVGIECLDLAGRVDQAPGVRERRKAHACARSKPDTMHRQPQARGEFTVEAKTVTGFHDEQPWPVDGGDLVENVVERGRLA